MTHSVNDLHERIIRYAKPGWQKVAMVIAKVYLLSDNQFAEHEIGEGVADLVTSGKLASRGDISNWRFSEVRLADEEGGVS